MKYLKYLTLIFILLLTTSCQDKENINLKDDYYSYVNKKLLNTNKIEKGEYTWSTFTEAQDKVDKQTDKIVEDLLNNHENKNLNILYNQLLDDEERNREGISPLEPYLDKIDTSSNIDEFIKNAIDIENDLSIDIFTNITIDADFKDTSKNIIYFSPITFDFGTSSDYYVNEDYMNYKALIKQYGIKLLKQYGYDQKKAREISSKITSMYESIASKSKLSNELSDISSYYNIITKDDLQKIYTNIDIDYYLETKNIPQGTKFSIIDIDNYKALNNYLTEENLSLLKEYVKLKILENYALYLSNDYSNLIYELNNKISGTSEDTKTNIDKANEVIKTLFNYDIDEKYQSEYLTAKEKKYIEDMIVEIIEYYEKDLKSLDWLSNKTKKKAITKLKNIKINIGLQEDYPKYSKEYDLEKENTLVENIIKISDKIKEYEINKLNTNKKDQAISQTTVNAYYNPSDNSINFPVASINLFDIDHTYYQNLGSIGMVIAHEITHAFDDNGSQFDEYGNINNWWTNKDLSKYKKLKKKVINYYNKYEVIDGEYIDGEKTVNENIADLGAISCITNLANSKNATDNELKEMYESLANMWATISTEEYQKLLLLQDTHAPSKYRVNATLSSTDTFYEVYNIKKYNDMYIAKNERIHVW